MRVVAVAVLFAGTLAMVPAQPAFDTGALQPGDAWILMDGDVPGAMAAAEEAGLRVFRLPQLDMAIVGASAASVALLEAHFGVVATPDWTEQLHLDKSVPYIDVPAVRDLVGYARTGPTVLVIDTGVSSAHPDFQDGNLAANIRSSQNGGVIDAIQQDVPVVDPSGHGTHVAGIVAGSGAGAAGSRTGPYEGVYSNGRVISFQAAVQSGDDVLVSGQAIMAAFDWALANQALYDIRVVSNSWGTPGDFDAYDPVERATLRLYTRGILTVFSAGNEGASDSLNRHCMAPWSLCVAGGNLDGRVDSYSSRGAADRPYAHPDVTAPGTSIRAPAAVEDSDVTRLLSGQGEALYIDRTGTSMAAPHVAAVAALLWAEFRTLSPDQVMDAIVAGSLPMREDVSTAGAGYLSAPGAYTEASRMDGNRERFLAGQAVKYGGPLTGDKAFAIDAVTGLDLEARATRLADGRPVVEEEAFLPVLAGGTLLLLLAAVLGVFLARR